MEDRDDERNIEGYPLGLERFTRTNVRNDNKASVGEGVTLAPLMMWSCILSGACLTGIIFMGIILSLYMRKVEVLQLHQSDMKTAMVLHGVNPHPHMEGESP